MKVEHIKPFAQAALDVLKEVIDVPVTRGEMRVIKTPASIHDVAVFIGLTGDIKGRVLFDMNLDTAKKIAEVMNYEEFDSFNNLCKATISELGNIIAGKAVSELNDNGFKFTITPPILLVGSSMETSDQAGECLIIPLESAYGAFNVNIALKNGQN